MCFALVCVVASDAVVHSESGIVHNNKLRFCTNTQFFTHASDFVNIKPPGRAIASNPAHCCLHVHHALGGRGDQHAHRW